MVGGLRTHAQPVNIRLEASGSGTVETPCPKPYQVGQGYVAKAIPAAGARFLRWEDGSTNPERYQVLDAIRTNWIASFETVVPLPFLQEFGLDQLDPNYMARVGLLIESGRARLDFALPGKIGFRVLASTNLATMPFTPIRFSLSANGPLDLERATGEVGPGQVWVPVDEIAHTFYRVELTGGGNLPAVYLAQATSVSPGAEFFVYGTGFKSGTVSVESSRGVLPAQVIDDQTLLVRAPSSAGDLSFRVKVGSALIPGQLALQVAAPPADLTLGLLPKETVVDGGLLRLTGSGFTGAETKVFVGSVPVQVVAVAPSGKELGVKIPLGTASGLLSVTRAGRQVVGQRLEIKPSLVGYTAFVPQGLHISTWETAKPRRFGYVPFVPQGLHVSTWETAKPRRFGYVPFVPQGLHVSTWETAKPRRFGYVPFVPNGLFVESK